MFQSIVQWSGPGGAGGVSVVNHDAFTIATRGAWQQVLSAWASAASEQWTARLQQEVRVLDPETGQLTDVDSYSSSVVRVGDVSGEPALDASSLLIRGETGAIVAGRRLRARMYVPGMAAEYQVGGNWAPDAISAGQGMLIVLYGATLRWVSWHRPVNGAGGLAARVSSGSVWDEGAVMRSRRNQ